MTKPRLPLNNAICTGLLLVVLSPSTYALRCGSSVIADDAHISEVIDKCGEPVLETTKKEYVTTYGSSHITNQSSGYTSESSHSSHAPSHSDVRVGREVTREIQITELIYDFGVERFKRKLRFVDGHLDNVTQLRRGSPH